MNPVMVAVLAAAWVAAMLVGFGVVFPVLFPLTLVVAGLGAAALSYLQACRALTPSSRSGPSPVPAPEVSYRHYLLGQVWRDWWAIAREVGPRVWTLARDVVLRLTEVLLGGPWGWFAFPVWLALCAGIVVAAVPAAVLALALTALYGVVAAVGLAGWLACAVVLAAVERVFTAYGRILQTCPHPFCYERIGLPVYACPGCGARHARLVPGPAGAFRHVCRCGTRLPTTVLLGRFRLAAYCPHCSGRLPPRIGRVRVEPLPFVGGPGAGKTTFMMLGIRALHARARAVDGRVAFVEGRHAEAYAATVRAFRSGGRPPKTGPDLPLATMLDVELPAGRRGKPARRILYLFDPAGEHFAGSTEVESLRYLDHGETLLFIVDPFALPQVNRSLTAVERARVEAAAGPSGEDPADTLQRVLNELRSRPDRGRQKRVAVVITKTDLLLTTEIGKKLYEDPDLRGWLRAVGLGNIVRALDHVAADVRYFGSGLATDPSYIADLLGWAAGLSPAEPSDAPASPDPADEIPGTAPLRAPWPVRGRDAALVPAGYQVGRWTVLAGMSALTVLAIAVSAAEVTARLAHWP
ncbi:TRAFAC clade GTPase domain-containing protein [Actinomadura rayongensis]|uniref:Double-GTPase 2 domain-containing protein n=1 Tax=Actinomadura rayongensis TaxID=1429076 RepID=A0A6I4WHT5_9ACTN|nr:hypothetical protein [Actinomadura rayongensis]MXQ67376.1 hypothetical protein [Actinomadura rayongensis]